MPSPAEQPPTGPGGSGLTPQEKAHFKFAAILIFGTMLVLPLLGAIWILLMRWGVIARP